MMTTRDERKERPSAKKDGKRATHGTRTAPMVAERSKLEVPPKIKALYPPDQHFYWENDEEGAVQRREMAGWVKVDDEEGRPIKLKVGRGKSIDNMEAVLMTICDEYWQEDRKRQEERNMAPLRSLKKGKEKVAATSTSGGEYSPNLDNGDVGYSEKTETIS